MCVCVCRGMLNCFVFCCRISEWQRRYHARDSKPEDLETIKELKMIVREQEQKMREFIVSHFREITDKPQLLTITIILYRLRKDSISSS